MNFINLATAKLAELPQLVQPDNFVGWSYYVDFGEMKILTNDFFKRLVRGVPHNAFLVAARFDPSRFTDTPVDAQEVILLRVTGSCPLPQDADLLKTKVDMLQAKRDKYEMKPHDPDDLTQNQIQYGGLVCRVLGTFYMLNGVLHLGSDQESFDASAQYEVYRPKADALEMIVNHVDPRRVAQAKKEALQAGLQDMPKPIRIGTVRYTSTARLHRSGPADPLVPVTIFPSDFLARRSAVLGMSRTGKSNTVKTTVAMVKSVADQSGIKIGQLIYDINGEYANANQQDQGAIAEVYPGETVRYRMLRTPGFLELQNNFYTQLPEGHNLIIELLRTDKSIKSDAVSVFLDTSFEEPDDKQSSEYKRWQVRAAAYQAMLHRAGFDAPAGHRVRFQANQKVQAAVIGVNPSCTKDPNSGLSLDEAVEWFVAARTANRNTPLPSSTKGKNWLDDDTVAILNMLDRKSQTDAYIRGYTVLTPARDYHSPRRASEVGDEIYAHLTEGKIVILDLSVGDPMIRERISKQIARDVFNKSMGTFVKGGRPPNVMIYVEEAHNLLGKGAELTDTWPRIAKEGAKYRIGLVYATQEVTSMHPNIMANTENWFVTHLNNEGEIKRLSEFYDFADFADSLLQAQDVGFARVKTLSSPFVVPVQIDEFDPAKLKEEQARLRSERDARALPDSRGHTPTRA